MILCVRGPRLHRGPALRLLRLASCNRLAPRHRTQSLGTPDLLHEYRYVRYVCTCAHDVVHSQSAWKPFLCVFSFLDARAFLQIPRMLVKTGTVVNSRIS